MSTKTRARDALSLLTTIDAAIDTAGCTTVADVKALLAGMISAAKDASR